MLRIGLMPMAGGPAVAAGVRAVLTSVPGTTVQVGEAWANREHIVRLARGQVDALVLIGPVSGCGLQVATIGTVRPHAVLAPDHALAQRPDLALADFLPLPTFARPDGVDLRWREYWLAERHRGGPPRFGPAATTPLEGQVLVAGHGLAGLAPRGWGAELGLVSRPVRGLPAAPVVVCTRDHDDPLVRRFVEAAEMHAARAPRLTPAQQEVAGHVARGLTNQEIADVLRLSRRTVESHVAAAVQRLGVRSRTELAVVSAR